MMESANLWKGDDLARFGTIDWPGDRTVLTQGQVSVGAVIVVEVGCENAPQMPLADDDQVVEAFSSDGASRAAAQPIILSTKGFCQGDRGAVTTSSIPMALILARTRAP